MIYDGYLGLLGTLDGVTCEVVVVGPAYIPDPAHDVASDLVSILGREPVDVSTTLDAGTLTVSLDSDPEVDVSSPIVGGWALVGPGASDAERPLIAWFDDPGGWAPDPYPISTPDGVAVVARG